MEQARKPFLRSQQAILRQAVDETIPRMETNASFDARVAGVLTIGSYYFTHGYARSRLTAKKGRPTRSRQLHFCHVAVRQGQFVPKWYNKTRYEPAGMRSSKRSPRNRGSCSLHKRNGSSGWSISTGYFPNCWTYVSHGASAVCRNTAVEDPPGMFLQICLSRFGGRLKKLVIGRRSTPRQGKID